MMNKMIFDVILVAVFSTPGLAQYPNLRVSKVESTKPEEVTIAVNPANPRQLAAGANINFYYASIDGGLTWTETRLTSSLGVYGDPCVIFDALGNLYYGHLSNPPAGTGDFLDRIVVQKSTNGITWNDGAGIGLNPPKDQDKEWLAADMTNSPYKNNLYISWTEFDKYGSPDPGDSSRILFSRSTDAGATWSKPVKVSDLGGDCVDSDSTVEGAVPAVGPNGEIYLAWAGPLGIMFDKSTDGGVTFGRDRFVAAQPGGWDFNVPGIYRCNGLPITACDVSSSPYRGNVYVAWSDQRRGVDDTDIFFIKSTDGGESFVNFKVSESAFTPDSSIFFGDYINIAAYKGKVHPIWMRMDGANLSVWTAIVDDGASAVRDQNKRALVKDFSLSSSYPNPLRVSADDPITTISYALPSAQPVTLKVYDVFGREIVTLVNARKEAGAYQVRFDGNTLASGIYFYQLTAGSFSAARKLLVIR